MFELVKSGGWLMLPIIVCSIVALGIVFERLWSLQRKRVMPDYLMKQIVRLHKEGKLNLADINKLRTSSPLGRILSAGLINRKHNKEVMKEAIEEVGRQVVHDLERYLNTLGTIASISPLLGLLGTVIGMIKVFSVIVTAGVGDPGVLAGGISEALITTAAGLSVAIPTLMFHRYFSGLIDRLVIGMEEQALKLVEVIHGERELR
ncbi:MAG: MotA/TolQ/ExbB proton channel family protein [Candidatus Thiodiazotropha sp. (ex Epidulcina cf. delphinae)]|nr:MotA/TolQ/ExbB proton channel family protein [Candidatus Thiodiazotropha sp. (ex Epidulcina cf. delphinae)]